MLFLVPFFILLSVLYFTKDNLYAVLSALLSSFFVFSYVKKISLYAFFVQCLPRFSYEIISPAGYFYPIAFLFLVAFILTIFHELHILDSYAYLISRLLSKVKEKFFDISLVILPCLFFIDDYLIMMGMKNFFTPLLEEKKDNKYEFAFFMSMLSSSATVLFFVSTWVAIITTQIHAIKDSILSWQNQTEMFIFLSAKQYLVYPILIYLFFIFYTFLPKKSHFSLKKYDDNQNNFFWEDIGIFLLLPLGICSSFFYKCIYFGFSLCQLDVSAVMFEGILLSLLFILFFLFLCKSISFSFVTFCLQQTFDDYKKTIITLLCCWLFSKITILVIDLDFNFCLPDNFIFCYPVLYFLLSVFIGFILGSEWGTLGIVITLLTFAKNYIYLEVLLGAVISGALAGSHLSPVSNTSLTSSAIIGIDPFIAYKYRVKKVILLIAISAVLYFFIGIYFHFFYSVL